MKTVGQKLFIKKGMTLRMLLAPENFTDLIGDHEGTLLTARSKQLADVVLLFARNREEMEAKLESAKQHLAEGGALWMAYPKKTSSIKSDIHRDIIHDYAPLIGLDTVSLISIDDDWSCMRLKLIS